MSEYKKLKEKGITRGRPRHTDEQRAISQIRNAVRQEARRRAHLVLKSRHVEEFNAIYEAEMSSLMKDATSGAKTTKRTSKS